MKKLMVIVMVFITTLVVSNMNIKEVKAEGATTLVVHYHRFDPNYAPWKLWLWQSAPNSGSGADHNFNGEDDFGKVYTLELAGTPLEGATEVGVIVKTSSWDKDVAKDLFINMTNPNENGEVHAYLVSGDATVYYSPDGIDISARAKNVNFQTTTNITFEASKDVTVDQLSLLENGTEVAISNFSISNGNGSFDIATAADLSKSYELIIDFEEANVSPKSYNVGFSGLYASDEFNAIYAYDGDLGAIYSPDSTTFKLWAPISTEVQLNLYTKGHKANQTDYNNENGVDTPYEVLDMSYTEKGVWEVTVDGDLHGVYYTFSVTNGINTNEVTDPYAYSSGVNGQRGMVVDFERLNPDKWDEYQRPNTIMSYNDAIIYELHVRDFTTHSSWNGTDEYRGKFLGLTEQGTTYNGVTTGLDHIIELGVTHVQLLPVFDFGAAVDETRLLDPTYQSKKDTVFNWGYMPELFNAVEGSFSTDPYDGSVRIEEYKTLIQTFHKNGINVIMDVVYNHHGKSADSNFDQILPGYYFRMTESGGFSNGSGTGNETASEHYMMRKFMVDSLSFWAEEYRISGFRFDLMKLHDYTTMKQIKDALHEIDDNILIYGEPWNGGSSPLPLEESAYNGTLEFMPGVGVFNDDTRDGIKGSVFDEETPGFVQGDKNSDERIKLGIVGATAHKNLITVALPKGAWAPDPNQTINYATAHDNNTLFDKLMLSTEDVSYDQIKLMQKQANAIVLTSNGVPFLHAGVEIMRTKPCITINGENQGECDSTNSYDHNSYRSPDETNQIDWQWKVDNMDVFNYYKGLIQLRKSTTMFSLDSVDYMNDKLQFLSGGDSALVSYIIYDEENPWMLTYVIHNANKTNREVDLQGYEWNVVVDLETAGTETLYTTEGTTLSVRPNETIVMYVPNPDFEYVTSCDEDEFLVEGSCVVNVNSMISDDTPEATLDTAIYIIIGAGVVIVLGGGFYFIRRMF